MLPKLKLLYIKLTYFVGKRKQNKHFWGKIAKIFYRKAINNVFRANKSRKISTFEHKISQSLKEYIWAAFAVLFLKKIA